MVRSERLRNWKRHIVKDRYLLWLVSPVVAYYVIFHYIPIYGIIIAFKDFSPGFGITGSPWAGFRWFMEFFESVYFWRIIQNTLLISLYSLLFGFPIPIVFALLLNECRNMLFKRAVQTISYLPYFISVVVVVGMMVSFLSVKDGVVNGMIGRLGGGAINFLEEPSWFRTLYVSSEIWQTFGYSSIIYIAALSAINPELYEASVVDGANRWNQMLYITLPGILPVTIIILILSTGALLSVGYEKIILLYSPQTYETADVISTYVYRRGLVGGQYSFGAAVGFFNSVINFIVLLIVNKIAKKVSGVGLW